MLKSRALALLRPGTRTFTFKSTTTNMTKHDPFPEVQARRPDFDVQAGFEYTKSPQPDWTPGQGLNSMPGAEHFKADSPFREIEPGVDLDNAATYKMMTWAVAPRPVAFVSTMDKDGVGNLAPISYFNMIGHDPPAVMISLAAGKTSTGFKDTANNIIALQEFSISLISEPFLEASNFAAIDSPEDQSEWPLTGLTKRESRTIKVPHVAESAFSMECSLMHQYDIKNDSGKVTQNVILGRVKRFHIKEGVIDQEDPDVKILPEKYKVISRLGGWTYGRTTTGYELPRPIWEKEKDKLKKEDKTEVVQDSNL